VGRGTGQVASPRVICACRYWSVRRLRRKIRSLAKKRGVSMSAVVSEEFEKYKV
jgi:hypothetical protein